MRNVLYFFFLPFTFRLVFWERLVKIGRDGDIGYNMVHKRTGYLIGMFLFC